MRSLPADFPGVEIESMEPIVSGTTTERIVRSTILMVMFLGYSAWSFYDGYVGYPHGNVVEFLAAQGFDAEVVPTIDPTLTEERTAGLATELVRRSGGEVRRQLGEPGYIRDDAWYYFGPGARLKIIIGQDRVLTAEAEKAQKTEIDLFWQKVIGWVTGLIGLAALGNWVRAVTTRVILSDDGLKVRGAAMVPFSAMKRIEAEQYLKTGYLDLIYEADGRTRKLRLDNYVIRAFRPIISKICEHRGFTNPLPPGPDEPGGENPNAALVDRASPRD